jgi:signal peptidase II
MDKLKRIYAIPAFLLVLITVLDQWSKLWALDRLSRAEPWLQYGWARTPDSFIKVVDSWFWFRYAENRAAAFSLTQSIPEWIRMPLLITVSIGAIIGVLIWLNRLGPKARIMQISLGLILGGALGNLIDRVRLGYVVDFIDWHLRGVNPSYTFPTFNVADSAIVCGGILVLLFGGREERQAKADQLALEEALKEQESGGIEGLQDEG